MNTIYLVRHGENPANITKEFSSRHVDYWLTDKGRLQAQQTADYFAGLKIDEVYASPLKRARETGQIIAARLGLTITVMDNFREVDVGDLELLPTSMELWDWHNRTFFGWIQGQHDEGFPNGDTYHTLWGRMREGIRQVTAGKNGRHMVIVGHGGIFTATMKDLCPGVNLRELLKAPSGNCSIAEVEVETAGDRLHGRLKSWGSTAHLSGYAAELVPGIPDRGTFPRDHSSTP